MIDGVRLSWIGKRPAPIHTPPPVLQQVESAPEITSIPAANRLICGDNLDAMAALHTEFAGRFALIYLDPPFFTGKQWLSRSNAPTAQKMVQGSTPTKAMSEPINSSPEERSSNDLFAATDAATRNSKSGIQDQTGFSDHWSGDLSVYLQWLYDRLSAARSLLAPDGCMYLHLSWHSVHYAKLIMDEVFGADRFQNEIIWCYREAINSRKRWNRKHDNILFYSMGDDFTFNCDTALEPYSESTLRKFKNHDENGSYRLMGRGITDSPLRSKRDLAPEMETLFPELTYRHYLGEGTLPVDYWHIDIENQASRRRTGYPTQKPEALMERILLASSNGGDLIGDFCCGSGTTLAVADRLGRRWFGCDANPTAVAIARARLTAARARLTEYVVQP